MESEQMPDISDVEQFVLRQAQDDRVSLSGSAITQILAAARSADPHEACGLLLGRDQRITHVCEAQNIHPEPETHFEIDPQALIDAHKTEREGGLAVMGYFHSHPTGDPVPSATDRATAAGDGKVWAIATRDEVRFWLNVPDGFRALSYEVEDS